jgi:hypothetical protein
VLLGILSFNQQDVEGDSTISTACSSGLIFLQDELVTVLGVLKYLPQDNNLLPHSFDCLFRCNNVYSGSIKVIA